MSVRQGRLYGLATYLLGQILSQATSVIRSLIVPNLLGPAGYGLVATVNAVDRYTPYVNAGSHYWIVNRLPVVDSEDERRSVVNTIFTFTLVTALIGAAAFLVVSWVQWSSRGFVVGFGVATLALNPIATGLWRVHTALLRVDERIPLMMRLTNAQTFVSTALIIGLTYGWGVTGTFTAQLLTSVFTLSMVAMSPYRLGFAWNWTALRTVLAFAVPVFLISGLLSTFVDTMEIFVLAHRMGVTSVGLYAWGISMATLLLMWPNGVANIYSTPVVRGVHADQQGGGTAGVEYFLRLIVTNAFLFAGLATMMCVALPVVALVLFPKFVSAVAAAQLLVVSMYYEGIRSLGTFVLTAQGRFNRFLVLFAAISGIVLPVLWYVAPLGLAWLAAVAIARRLATAHVVLHIGVRHAFPSRTKYWLFCGGLYALGLLPLPVSRWLDSGAGDFSHGQWVASTPRLAATFLVVILFVTGSLYALHRRFRVLAPLWHA